MIFIPGGNKKNKSNDTANLDLEKNKSKEQENGSKAELLNEITNDPSLSSPQENTEINVEESLVDAVEDLNTKLDNALASETSNELSQENKKTNTSDFNRETIHENAINKLHEANQEKSKDSSSETIPTDLDETTQKLDKKYTTAETPQDNTKTNITDKETSQTSEEIVKQNKEADTMFKTASDYLNDPDQASNSKSSINKTPQNEVKTNIPDKKISQDSKESLYATKQKKEAAAIFKTAFDDLDDAAQALNRKYAINKIPRKNVKATTPDKKTTKENNAAEKKATPVKETINTAPEKKVPTPQAPEKENIPIEDAKEAPQKNDEQINSNTEKPSDEPVVTEKPLLRPGENRDIFTWLAEKKQNCFDVLAAFDYSINHSADANIKIAFNQLWLDRRENKALKLKNKITSLDVQIEALTNVTDRLESTNDEIKGFSPSTKENLKALRKASRSLKKLQTKRNTLQIKFENQVDKMTNLVDKRNVIADKIIGHYTEFIKPMEKNLSELMTYADQINLTIEVTEAKHAELTKELDALADEKQALEDDFRSYGEKDRKIKRMAVIKTMAQQIKKGHISIRKEKEALQKEKLEMNRRVTEAKIKVDKHTGKKNKFVSIREGQPIITLEKGGGNTNPVETIHREKKEVTFSKLASKWNTYIQGKKTKESLEINEKAFQDAFAIDSKMAISKERFKKILKAYFTMEKYPAKSYETFIKNFN